MQEGADIKPIISHIYGDLKGTVIHEDRNIKATVPNTHTDSVVTPSNKYGDGEDVKTSIANSCWPCLYCAAIFLMKSDLNNHMKAEHGAAGGVKCPICDRLFANQGNLKRHQITHTGDLKFQCKICGKKISTKINLVGHMNLHTGEKTFQCDLCLEYFHTRPRLLCHKKQCINMQNQYE